MKLIVGLGNPGRDYENTRHNLGFVVIDQLADGASWSTKKAFKGELAEIIVEKQKVLLLKPTTFMNLSGDSVRAVADFYKIAPADIVIIHDDLDLAFGKIVVKNGQTAAGHNGVQSIIDAFGGALDFTRVRIGIGRPIDPAFLIEDWVLSHWSLMEKNQVSAAVHEAAELTKSLFSDNV